MFDIKVLGGGFPPLDLPDIPPIEPSRLGWKSRLVYDLALEKGIKNPIPHYIERVWSVSGDNIETHDLGFTHSEAIDNLSRMQDVFGGEIVAA